MNKKAVILIVIASLSGSVSKAQTQERMTAKQIAIRDKQVEINYFQQGQAIQHFCFYTAGALTELIGKIRLNIFLKITTFMQLTYRDLANQKPKEPTGQLKNMPMT